MRFAPFKLLRLTFFSAAVLVLFSVLASGQGNRFEGHIAPRGVPASVTSFGFGGHPGFHGVPASVTATGFGGQNAFRGFPPSVTSLGFGEFHHGFHDRNFEFRRHRHHFDGFGFPFYGGYYAPYYYPYYLSDEDYSGQPAGYDYRDPRDYDDRQVLNDDYRADLKSPREPQTQSGPEPVADQPSTILIFKDGHQLEIANYAIVGPTLYDLSDGRTRRVQLADLDLPATVRENDDRGIQFQVPTQTKVN